MLLAVVGIITIILVLALIVSKKTSPMIAMALVPAIACLIVDPAGYGGYAVAGIKSVAPTMSMFAFAIIFFNTLIDYGTFEPVINAAVRFSHNDPVKIMMAVVVIASAGHLDGAGSTTYLLTLGTMAPIFDRMKLKKYIWRSLQVFQPEL